MIFLEAPLNESEYFKSRYLIDLLDKKNQKDLSGWRV